MKVRKGTYQLKYYSFIIGHPQSSRTEQILFDIKIPASCVKEAILLHSFSQDFQIFEYYGGQTKNVFYPVNQSYVFLKYRTVLEYERLYTPKRGFTVHQYRKIKQYTNHSILHLFKK